MRHQVDPWWRLVKSISIGLVLSLLLGGGMGTQPVWAQNPRVQGNVYYVAPTGSDGGPGTLTQPWRTIQKAAQTMVAGDTVYIRAGTYREQVVPMNSGSPGAYITYIAYPGETPTLDGSGIALLDSLVGLFEVSGKSYIRVSGLRVANVTAHSNNGGIIVKRSSYITIEKSNTDSTISSGIGVWNSQHVTVTDNRVERACTSGSSQECLTIAGTASFQVGNNEVLDCGDEGIDVKNGSSDGQVFGNHVHHTASVGIYLDGYEQHTYGIEVYQNLIHDVSGDNGIALASEKGGLLENVHIYDNIIHHNRYCGILLSRAGSGNSLGQHPMKSIWITNNTIYNNGWTGYGGGILVDNPDAQETIIRNNLVSQNLSFQIAVDLSVQRQHVTIDHSLVDGYRGYPGETYGSAYVADNPLFIDPVLADFHLRAGSPAIDAGSAAGTPTDDYEGTLRPLDGDGDGVNAHDIGAYEMMWQAVVPPIQAIPPGGVATYTILVGALHAGQTVLSVSTPDPDLTVQIVPTSLVPPGQATLTVTDGHSGSVLTSGLWFTIPITATSGVVQTMSARLLVTRLQVHLPVVRRAR